MWILLQTIEPLYCILCHYTHEYTGLSVRRCFVIVSQAKDMQQMVKLEEEMDRRPATVV